VPSPVVVGVVEGGGNHYDSSVTAVSVLHPLEGVDGVRLTVGQVHSRLLVPQLFCKRMCAFSRFVLSATCYIFQDECNVAHMMWQCHSCPVSVLPHFVYC